MFNICGAMGPYGVLAILNIVWRFSHVKNGTCVIGMEKKALMPLIIFDVAVNVYLTTLFIVPLRLGKKKVLFSVLTLHWVTSRDRTGQTTNRSYSRSNGEPGPAAVGGSNSRSYSKHTRSRDRDNQRIIGTETLISDHYQDRAANHHTHSKAASISVWPDDDHDIDIEAAAHGDDGGRGTGGPLGASPWPEDTRAVVSAQCARADVDPVVDADPAAAEGIALGRIVVTKQSELRALTREEERREQRAAMMLAAADEEEEEERRRRHRHQRRSAGTRNSKAAIRDRDGRRGSRGAATIVAGAGVVMAAAMAGAGVGGGGGGSGEVSDDAASGSTASGGEAYGGGVDDGVGRDAREGSTDEMILAAPGPVHMV
ncbi:hypothetical protein BK809_0006430 [Diplodia seriata]|uniref:Uncharacterized protein n=1 Tax=Diplodia seriata TaxID=420778 RepID=A0A1S8B3I9_9PEZI|nr:hypothetical protein BK809_0006430 [Diplodia seriata]